GDSEGGTSLRDIVLDHLARKQLIYFSGCFVADFAQVDQLGRLRVAANATQRCEISNQGLGPLRNGPQAVQVFARLGGELIPGVNFQNTEEALNGNEARGQFVGDCLAETGQESLSAVQSAL